jgi:hypothetical protein
MQYAINWNVAIYLQENSYWMLRYLNSSPVNSANSCISKIKYKLPPSGTHRSATIEFWFTVSAPSPPSLPHCQNLSITCCWCWVCRHTPSLRGNLLPFTWHCSDTVNPKIIWIIGNEMSDVSFTLTTNVCSKYFAPVLDDWNTVSTYCCKPANFGISAAEM